MDLELIERVNLRSYNTFGVEARARWFARIAAPEQLERVDDSPKTRGQPRVILGGGSNVLLTGDIDGLVLKIDIPGLAAIGETDDAWLYRVGAGENWHATVERLLALERSGLENLALIPGQVGAAPIQNIGAYGLEIAERLHAVHTWDWQQRCAVDMTPADCNFGYRDSAFKQQWAGRRVVTGVTLALPKRWAPVTAYADIEHELKSRGRSASNVTARDVFDAVCTVRRRKLPDPLAIGNAGSFFKNPIVPRDKQLELIARFPSLVSYALPGGRFKLAAGWLIEACGLKGATRGRAGVFEKQALVLVNRGGATGGEILALAREVQDKVREKFGVQLEPEPVIV